MPTFGSTETIVAVATPPGKGAVGVLRVSGPGVPQVAVEIVGSLPPPRTAHLARFTDSSGQTLDRGLALYFPAPASFTGEAVLELQGHGGAVVMDLLLERILTLGCRMARPGEFSERAFLNGKMDIAQAEAIADLIDAATVQAARAAARSMQGEFSARIDSLQVLLNDLRVYVEAAIDFPEEDIDFLTDQALAARLALVFDAFSAIAEATRRGALLREGLTVVIAGKPNAGKSSLLNRLVGRDVAIVTAVPGTTRDLGRHQVHIDGMPLNLVDTAGLRAAADVVEEEGIRRAREEIRRADHVLYVIDACGAPPLASDLADLPPGTPVTRVVNKIDLAGLGARLDSGHGTSTVYLSARTGEGVGLLRDHLTATAGYLADDSALSARRRHLDALARARALTENAAAILASTRAFELFAEDLRLAQQALSEITGEFTSDDLLGQIFSSFCLGK